MIAYLKCWVHPALRRQSQADLLDFEASLLYRTSSRIPRLHRESLSQKKKIIISIHIMIWPALTRHFFPLGHGTGMACLYSLLLLVYLVSPF
jgi:membrane-associated phospholipid phosphatase